MRSLGAAGHGVRDCARDHVHVARPLALRWVLVGTALILPLAYLVRNLLIAGRAVLAGFRQLDPALEEAAASLGAGRWATLGRVTLPLLQPALAAGASLAFVTALGDFVTSIVLYTHDTRPIAMEISPACARTNWSLPPDLGLGADGRERVGARYWSETMKVNPDLNAWTSSRS